jgi:hypothetical protein
MSDEGKPVRLAFSVTHQRVQHYDDIVEYMVATEVERCRREDHFTPSTEQVVFLRKEIVRYAVIAHDLNTAQKVRINKTRVLVEQGRNQSD